MTNIVKKTIIFTALLMLPMISMAQVDQFGAVDTMYAELAKINDHNWSITISYSNDEAVVAFSIPLKMTAGMNRIVADSAIYTGGRVEQFVFKGFRPDTAIQCVTLGIIGTLSQQHIFLPPGQGRLVTIFVSSLEKKPIEMLKIDTTTTSPNNSLMVIADRIQGGDKPDTIPLDDRERINIYPEFVVIEPK